eukprot:1188745-Prorocentrum_minimum.AAC.2
MVFTFETSRRGTNPAQVLLYVIGAVCCACSLIFAFGGSVKISTGQETSDSQQASLALSEGLQAIRQKLVDPDAQSDELEHPAILLDPDSLTWDNKKRKAVSDEGSGESPEEPPEESREESPSTGEHEDQPAGDIRGGEAVEIDGEIMQMKPAQRVRDGDTWVPLESAPVEVEDNDEAERPQVPASTRRRARRASRYISDSSADLTKPSQEEEQEQDGAQSQDDVRVDSYANATLSKRDAESVKRFGKCALTQALLDYTINRIRTAELHLDPYPHLYLTKIFEPSFYQNCLLVSTTFTPQ